MWKGFKKLNPIRRSTRNSGVVVDMPRVVPNMPPGAWVYEESEESPPIPTPSPPTISPPKTPSRPTMSPPIPLQRKSTPSADDNSKNVFTISHTALLFFAGTPSVHTIHLEVRSPDNVEIAHNLPNCFAVDRLSGDNSSTARIKVAYLPMASQQAIFSEPMFIKFTNKGLPVSSTNPMTVHVNIMEPASSTDQARRSVVAPASVGQTPEGAPRKRNSARHDPLECMICFFTFTDESGNRAPLVLKCGHTVCEVCATELYNSTLKVTQCPLDRANTRGHANQLSKNFVIIDVLRAKKEEQDYQCIDKWSIFSPRQTPLCDDPDVPCYENSLHESTCYCSDCKVTYCENCFIRIHSSKILSGHKMVKVEERPIDFPNCYFHKTVLAEFVCMKESCKNEPKICCKECIQTIHHNHGPYMRTKNLADYNLNTFSTIVNKLKISEVETMMMIQKANEQELRFDKAHEKYLELVEQVTSFYDQRKKNAISRLDNFMSLKKRVFQDEKEDVMVEFKKISEARQEIEKQLRKKNVLVGAEDLMRKGQEMCSMEVRERVAFLPFMYPNLNELTAAPTPPARGSTLEETVIELRSLINNDIYNDAYARPDQN